MQWFQCQGCGQQAPLSQMNAWVQEWSAGVVRHLCPTCRTGAPAGSACAVRREFYIDQHYLVRTRPVGQHHKALTYGGGARSTRSTC